MGQVSCILPDRHVCSEGGGGDTKPDSGHVIVLQRFTEGGRPDKVMEISIRLGELACLVYLADVRDQLLYVDSEGGDVIDMLIESFLLLP